MSQNRSLSPKSAKIPLVNLRWSCFVGLGWEPGLKAAEMAMFELPNLVYSWGQEGWQPLCVLQELLCLRLVLMHPSGYGHQTSSHALVWNPEAFSLILVWSICPVFWVTCGLLWFLVADTWIPKALFRNTPTQCINPVFIFGISCPPWPKTLCPNHFPVIIICTVYTVSSKTLFKPLNFNHFDLD